MVSLQDRDLRYRDASEEDAAALSAIGRDTFLETFGHQYQPTDLNAFLARQFTPEAQAAEIADPAVDIRVAEGGGRLVGYAKIGPVKLPVDHDPDASLELHRLYVREARQGLGLGRILLTWSINRARERGASHLYLGVWAENEKAISVYRSRGFDTIGRYDFHVGNHVDDELIMRLELVRTNGQSPSEKDPVPSAL